VANVSEYAGRLSVRHDNNGVRRSTRHSTFFLNKIHKEWTNIVEIAAREAKELGEFSAELNVAQYVFNMFAIFQAFHAYASLLNDRTAKRHTRTSFEGLIRRAKGEYQLVTPETKLTENTSIAGP